MSQRRNEGKNTMAVTTTTPFHVVMHGVPPYCRPPAPTTVVAYPPPPNAATTLATGNLCQCHAPPARDLNMKITRKITNPSRSGERSREASSRWGEGGALTETRRLADAFKFKSNQIDLQTASNSLSPSLSSQSTHLQLSLTPPAVLELLNFVQCQ